MTEVSQAVATLQDTTFRQLPDHEKSAPDFRQLFPFQIYSHSLSFIQYFYSHMLWRIFMTGSGGIRLNNMR